MGISREVRDELGEAYACLGLGDMAAQGESEAKAVALWTLALINFRRLGLSSCVERVEARIGTVRGGQWSS